MEIGEDNSLIFNTPEDEKFLRSLRGVLGSGDPYLERAYAPRLLDLFGLEDVEVEHTSEELRTLMDRSEDATADTLGIKILPVEPDSPIQNEDVMRLRERVLKRAALREHQTVYVLDRTWLPVAQNGAALLIRRLWNAEDEAEAIERNDPSSSIFAGKSDEEIEEIVADAEQTFEEDGVDAYDLCDAIQRVEGPAKVAEYKAASSVFRIIFERFMLEDFFRDNPGLR